MCYPPISPTVLFHLSRLWRYVYVHGTYFLLPTCLAYGATNMANLRSLPTCRTYSAFSPVTPTALPTCCTCGRYQQVTPTTRDSSLTNLLPFHSERRNAIFILLFIRSSVPFICFRRGGFICSSVPHRRCDRLVKEKDRKSCLFLCMPSMPAKSRFSIRGFGMRSLLLHPMVYPCHLLTEQDKNWARV